MKEIVLNVVTRKEKGKSPSARLRREGTIPAVAYGPKDDAMLLMLKTKDLKDILRPTAGESGVIKLKIDNQSTLKPAIIKDIQLEPVKDTILHVDFYFISADIEIKTTVKLTTVGEALGVKDFEGILNFAAREIEIECLPDKIPEYIEVDVSNLNIHDTLRVKDLDIPEGIKVHSDLEQLVANVVPPTVEEVPVEAEAEEVEEEVAEEEKVAAEEEKEKVEGKEEKEKPSGKSKQSKA